MEWEKIVLDSHGLIREEVALKDKIRFVVGKFRSGPCWLRVVLRSTNKSVFNSRLTNLDFSTLQEVKDFCETYDYEKACNSKVIVKEILQDSVDLYFEGQFIHRIKYDLQLDDILIQIKENSLKGYSVKELSGKEYKILDGGRIKNVGTIFPKQEEQLIRLMEV